MNELGGVNVGKKLSINQSLVAWEVKDSYIFMHIVQSNHKFLIIAHNNKPYHVPIKYRFLFKKSDDIRPTYLSK